MGAPKQKWTAEEETALRAGVARYGIGKWSAILKDTEFSGLLRSRSNVDLKDKWRNIHVMESGMGSRQRGKPAFKCIQLPPRSNLKSSALSTVVVKSPEALDTNALTLYTEASPIASSKEPISRLDDVVLKAVAELKEPQGSTRTSIALYIEEQYLVPSNFEKILAKKLKRMVENGQFIKVNHHYKLLPSPISFAASVDTAPSLLEGMQQDSSSTEKNGNKILNKSQIDNDLDKMSGMNAHEAAAAAAKAVAEAESAIAEAEAAAREADNAEAEAEAAYCFAEAARKALNCSNYPRLVNSDLSSSLYNSRL